MRQFGNVVDECALFSSEGVWQMAGIFWRYRTCALDTPPDSSSLSESCSTWKEYSAHCFSNWKTEGKSSEKSAYLGQDTKCHYHGHRHVNFADQ